VKVGGDFVHFRYVAFAYCLAVVSTGGIAEKLVEGASGRLHGRLVVPLALIAGLAIFTCYPRQLLKHPIFRHLGFEHHQFLNIEDAAAHRMNRQWTPALLSSGNEIELRHEMQRFVDSGGAMADSVVFTARCEVAYRMFDHYVIHSLGLTDPFLARSLVPLNRPGHKDSLVSMARDIAEVRARSGFRVGGFEGIDGAGWVEDNLDTIEAIERKAYNDHDIWSNLRLAWQGTGRIRP
jgi:hypothetical protein